MEAKTEVPLVAGMQPEACAKIMETVGARAHEIQVFRRGGVLVELHVLHEDETRGGVKRKKGSFAVRPMTPAAVARAFGKLVVAKKYDNRKGDWKPVDFPRSLAEAILSMPDWPQIPELLGVVQAPIVGLDGTEYSTPGYHPDVRLYLALPARLKPAPGVAGRSRGTEGIKRLRKLLRGFVFKTRSDEAAALACIITGLLRALLPSAPAFAVSAPTAATGKSLFAEVVCVIATGRKPAMMSLGNDEAEAEKRIGSALLEGLAFLVIDNVTRPFGHEPVLNQVSTQEFMKVRILGLSTQATVPTNTQVIITGNNLAIVGDMKRRTVLIQMDTGLERPEQRDVGFDVIQEALKDRNALLRACLDIVKVYQEAGCPEVAIDGEKVKPLGSFNDWDRMVRRALIYLGEADPIASAEVLREADPDHEAMTLLFSTWLDQYRDEAKSAAEVVQDAIDYGVARHTYPELHEAVSLACSGKIDGRRLGYWLRAHKSRICAGLQLVQGEPDGHSKVARWKVVKA